MTCLLYYLLYFLEAHRYGTSVERALMHRCLTFPVCVRVCVCVFGRCEHPNAYLATYSTFLASYELSSMAPNSFIIPPTIPLFSTFLPCIFKLASNVLKPAMDIG